MEESAEYKEIISKCGIILNKDKPKEEIKEDIKRVRNYTKQFYDKLRTLKCLQVKVDNPELLYAEKMVYFCDLTIKALDRVW